MWLDYWGGGGGAKGMLAPPLKLLGEGGLAPLFLRLCSLLELVWSNSSGLECGVHFKENQPCQFHFCTKLKPLVKNGWFSPPNLISVSVFQEACDSFLFNVYLFACFVKLISIVDVNTRMSHRLSPRVNDHMSWTFFE